MLFLPLPNKIVATPPLILLSWHIILLSGLIQQQFKYLSRRKPKDRPSIIMIIWITILQQCAHFPPTKQDGNLTQLRGKEKEKKNSEISAYLDWTAMMLNRVSFGLHNLVRTYINWAANIGYLFQVEADFRCKIYFQSTITVYLQPFFCMYLRWML